MEKFDKSCDRKVSRMNLRFQYIYIYLAVPLCVYRSVHGSVVSSFELIIDSIRRKQTHLSPSINHPPNVRNAKILAFKRADSRYLVVHRTRPFRFLRFRLTVSVNKSIVEYNLKFPRVVPRSRIPFSTRTITIPLP